MRPCFPAMLVPKALEDTCVVGKHSYADGGSPNIVISGEHGKLHIGSFVSIGPHCDILLGSEHRTDFVTTFPFSKAFVDVPYIECTKTKGNVVIGSDVWIGGYVTILSGVCIGHGAVIGAGSIVTRDVEPYTIVAGNPAREIRKRFTKEQINKLLKIKWWEWDDTQIEEVIPLLLNNNIDKFIEEVEGVKV